MTLITPEERFSRTAELLASLEDSVRELRQQVQDLTKQIEAGEDADLVSGQRRVAAADALVKTCQKVEANLVEQHYRQVGIAQGGYALDLEQARSEIGSRLDRLRACEDAGQVSE